MDFSYMGGNEWGTDQITPYTPINYGMDDIFVTHPKIQTELWNAPEKNIKIDPIIRQEPNIDFFTDQYDGYPQITENMLIILLLVILIVMCTMIYSAVNKTCEMLKLMTSAIISRNLT
jgi:hypothetical protein